MRKENGRRAQQQMIDESTGERLNASHVGEYYGGDCKAALAVLHDTCIVKLCLWISPLVRPTRARDGLIPQLIWRQTDSSQHRRMTIGSNFPAAARKKQQLIIT